MRDKNTVGLKVNDFDFMLGLLQQEFGPKIFLREYVQNSIEAIQNTVDKKGTIIIDWDMAQYNEAKKNGKEVYKMRITDNGVGMDEAALNKMAELFTKKTTNDYQNYGIGAKMSGLKRSPYGISYTSWVDNIGRSLILHWHGKNPGILTQIDDDNNPQTVISGYTKTNVPKVTTKSRNKICLIQNHGTSVTLLGTHPEDSTFDNPDPHDQVKLYWIPKYLGNRYYTIPQEIVFKIKRVTDPKRPHHHDKIYGQKHYLEMFKTHSGTVDLTFENSEYDANVHWWILDKKRTQSGWMPSVAGTSILFENELYHYSNSKSTKRMEMFGIFEDYKNIQIIVEPKDSAGFRPTMSREELVRPSAHSEQKKIPWETWGAEFEKNIPDVLKKHIEAITNKQINNSNTFGDSKSRKFAKKIKSLSKNQDAILHPKGLETDNVAAGEDVTHGSYIPKSINPRPVPPIPTPNPPIKKPIVKNGNERKKTLPYKPKDVEFRWVQEDELDSELIAIFTPSKNLIKGNPYFIMFENNLEFVEQEYAIKKITKNKSIIRNAYRNTIAVKMKAAVEYAKIYKKELGIEAFKILTSNEALLISITPDDSFITLMAEFCIEGKKEHEDAHKKEVDAVVNTQGELEKKQLDYLPPAQYMEQRV